VTTRDAWHAWVRREWAWYGPLALVASVPVLIFYVTFFGLPALQSHHLSEACRHVGGTMADSDQCDFERDTYGWGQIDELRRDAAEQP
jgi:hypothetical protein